MSDDIKKLPFASRKELFIKKLKDLCHEHDVDILPIITKFVSSINAQILFVDTQNKKTMEELGLQKKEDEMRLN